MMNRKQLALIILLASFSGGLLSLLGYKYLLDTPKYQSIEEMQNYRLAKYQFDTTDVVVPEGLNFVFAAEAVTPSVVHIKTYYEATASARQYPQSPFDDMLKDFFGERGIPDRQYESKPQQAAGSGVILSPDGYIVTNNHVVEKADKIEVVLNDKRSFTAKLIGTDPTTDLALIKIEEKNLPFIRYGNSDHVKIGEWVLAVGNPFNLTSTVTAGIVSAKARNINILRDKENLAIESFIQTDAVVNPGNSGGALVNLKGELIGINTAIASPTGSYAGYAFAIPQALVKKVIDDLLKYGQVQRALLGVSIMDLSSELAKEKGIEQIRGVYVAAVNSGSAADKAGIEEGDVITMINDTEVKSSSELQEIVARFRPGDKVKVTYVRKGKKHEASVVLKNKLGDTNIVTKESATVKSILGADLQLPSKSELEKLKIDGGAKVNKIYDGKLRDAGIREGFIITSIDKKPVKKPEDVTNILEKTPRDGGGVLIEGYNLDGKRDYIGMGW